ncbi:MAG: hypothetical protein LVQ97_02980 [Candidatus Micrarchaeales archaeon]|uniref:Methyltransferase type 11 n=1 Tax=Candidatus Micrarchaeum acidiphilum ARMAN-2 TaxID=425595 RepID=C7DGD6_MICA2|nr:MAG: hypothetical protein UNLARM2_0140 [Candidatus Micrarchaeum acidiphilum ARMAN-2]MCW6161123.1 hypothetical protein [Candidatus Micrarchaeales archaeon]
MTIEKAKVSAPGSKNAGYTKGFYDMYRDYLVEPQVRANHDLMFGIFERLAPQSGFLVMDLGCGLGEYSRYGHYSKYVGIDSNDTGAVKNFIKADYASQDVAKMVPYKPNAFVSLFSIEACYPANDVYELYERLFKENNSIMYGLTSGFFYMSRMDKETVGETGGIKSYQTIENQSERMTNGFVELRTYMETPSKMFGEDVVEVWKILLRK